MKFAAFTTVASSAGEATNAEQFIDNLRQQTVLAEELGFEAMWLGEHHFGPYGIGDLPNPILLGADLAARTSTDTHRADGEHRAVVASRYGSPRTSRSWTT